MTTPNSSTTGATPTPRTRKTSAGAADTTRAAKAAAPKAAGKTAAKSQGQSSSQAQSQAQSQGQGQGQGQGEQQRHARQQKVGRVTSNKMQKTIVVAVESLKRHPIYKRTYKSTNKFKAHDEENSARIGDTVRIEETRPLSKEKHWRLVEIIKRAEQTVAPEIIEEHLEEQEGLTPPSAGVGAATGR